MDIFAEYIIEEFALERDSVNAKLVGEAASPSGIYLILLTAVFGVIIISASSFISFCTWPTNFTVLNESGRTEADSQSVVSFLSGPLVMLLEASVTSWVWVDYNSFGAPFLTESDALGTALLIRRGSRSFFIINSSKNIFLNRIKRCIWTCFSNIILHLQCHQGSICCRVGELAFYL